MGDWGVRDAVPRDALLDEAGTCTYGTQYDAAEPEEGHSCYADAHTSPIIGDDSGGDCKVFKGDIPEALPQEGPTGAQGSDATGDLPQEGQSSRADEGGVAGDDPVPGATDEGRRSSNLVQRMKQRGRRPKVAAVRLSPYTNLTTRRYGVRCRRE